MEQVSSQSSIALCAGSVNLLCLAPPLGNLLVQQDTGAVDRPDLRKGLAFLSLLFPNAQHKQT